MRFSFVPVLLSLFGLSCGLFSVGFSSATNNDDSSYVKEEEISDREVEQAKNKVYLDYQASAPCDPRITSSLQTALETSGNPHSEHANGRLKNKFVRKAKSMVAKLINTKPRNIYFTSGATESNNLAIKGIVRSFPKGSHIITSNIEHKSVLEVFKQLEKEGYSVTYLKVDSEGLIAPSVLEAAITPKTKFVSIMMVNNEVGSVQDIKALGSICFKNNIIFHTDCAQAFGKLKIDVKAMRIDALSASGHKIYAPKGCGVLFISVKSMRKKGLAKFVPLMHGGGQQNNIRPGTMASELIYTMGLAASLASESMEADAKKCATLQARVHEALMGYNARKKADFIRSGGIIEDFEPIFFLNGPIPGTKSRAPFNLNYSIKGVDSKDLISELELRGFIVSAGSACNAEESYSYVVDAMDPDMTKPPATIRISFGRFSDVTDGEVFAETLIRAVEYLQQRYPDKGNRKCDKSHGKAAKGKDTKSEKAGVNEEKAGVKEVVTSKVELQSEKDARKEKEELEGLID